MDNQLARFVPPCPSVSKRKTYCTLSQSTMHLSFLIVYSPKGILPFRNPTQTSQPAITPSTRPLSILPWLGGVAWVECWVAGWPRLAPVFFPFPYISASPGDSSLYTLYTHFTLVPAFFHFLRRVVRILYTQYYPPARSLYFNLFLHRPSPSIHPSLDDNQPPHSPCIASHRQQ